MRLEQIRLLWSTMSRTEKLSIIEASQSRRIQSFTIIQEKREAKTAKKEKKPSSRRKSVSKTPSTPEGLMNLMKELSAEQRENILMALKLKL